MKKSKRIIKTILILWLLAKQGPVVAQTASLVATVRINPLRVEVTAPSSVNVGERFKVEATVRNLGETKIKKAKVEVFLNLGLSLKGNPERKLGVILAKDSKTASWRVTAEETGSHVILVEASGIEEETGDPVEASDTTTVEVKTFASFWSLVRKFLASFNF